MHQCCPVPASFSVHDSLALPVPHQDGRLDTDDTAPLARVVLLPDRVPRPVVITSIGLAFPHIQSSLIGGRGTSWMTLDKKYARRIVFVERLKRRRTQGHNNSLPANCADPDASR
jgi:hypothetical protein